jgi:DNA mismatch repair ATPase MutS
VKQRLEEVLMKTRQRFKDQRRINWSHAKYRYELEIPSEYVEGKKKPDDFEFTSQRKDYQRFHTKEIKRLIDELETAEERLQDALSPFLCALFRRFHERKETWNAALNLLTELDCLCSLAIVSGQQVGVMSRPQYVDGDILDIK